MPSSITVASGVYGASVVAIDQLRNVAAQPSPTFSLQVGGGPTAGHVQYVSGSLSGRRPRVA